jgi:hypothetical protein
MIAAPTPASDPQASGLTVEWNVVEVRTDRDGLETSCLHDTFDTEASAIAEADRMNGDYAYQPAFGRGESVEFIVDEVTW